jgi:hypothetical protein
MVSDAVTILSQCPVVTRAEVLRAEPYVMLVQVETVQGTTLPLPGFSLTPRVEEIDRFTPWLDRCLRSGSYGLTGTIPKSHRLRREVRLDGQALTLHLCLPPRQWGILATLLSSRDRFAKRLTSQRHHGGWLPSGWSIREEGVIVRSDGSLVQAATEEAFFAALSLPFVPRAQRR